MGKEVAAFGAEQLAIRRMLSGETVDCDAGEAVAEVGGIWGQGKEDSGKMHQMQHAMSASQVS